MQQAWIKNGVVALVAAVVVLLATNPSEAQFKTFVTGAKTGFFAGLIESVTCDNVQTTNWYVFSNYEHRCITQVQQCTGAFNTFFCGKVKPVTATPG